MSQTRRRDATAPNNRMMPTTVRLRHSSCLLPLVASRLRERLWVDLTLTRLYAGGLPQIPRHPAKHRDSCSCTCPFSANSWLGPSQKQEDERGAIRRGGTAQRDSMSYAIRPARNGEVLSVKRSSLSSLPYCGQIYPH